MKLATSDGAEGRPSGIPPIEFMTICFPLRTGHPQNYPNAFCDTNLKHLLDEQGIEELVMIGAMSHMGVEATTLSAADLGYPIPVVRNACATMI